MAFLELLVQAADSLKINMLRSFLTILSITMGIASVITVVAIGDASQSYMNKEFERIGSNVIMLQYNPKKNITQDDLLSLEDIDVCCKIEMAKVASEKSRKLQVEIP